MNCVICKGKMSQGVVNHIVDLHRQILMIKEVPAKVCNQCGEYFLDHHTALHIERITNDAVKALAEIFVVRYDEMVA